MWWRIRKDVLESKREEFEKCRAESKKIFGVLTELTNIGAPRTNVINDENGVALTEDDDIKRKRKEYSTKLYVARDHQQSYNRGREQDEPPPLASEVEQALQQIRNGKSPGADVIPAERYQEKKVLSYFGNCAQKSGGKRSGQRTGAVLYLSRFPRRET